MPARAHLLAAACALLWITSACTRLEPAPQLRIQRLTPSPEPLAQAQPVTGGGNPVPVRSSPPPASTSPTAAPPTPSPSAASGGVRGEGRYTPPAYVTPAASTRGAAGREDAALVNVIEEALGEDKDGASVVVKRLTDGATASWNPDRVHYAASLYKLTVLYEAFRQRKLGTLSFERTVPVTAAYVDQDLGTLGRLERASNGDLEIGEAVRGMVSLSDNTSATILLDLLGHRNIDATMRALGLTATSVNTTELPTTAADMARVMEAVVRGEGLDPEAAKEMMAMLLAQETRAGIPRGVPSGVAVGNKTGTWSGATHDVAVVMSPTGSYVIAVLTDGSWAWNPITLVSKAVYDYWNKGR